MPDVGSRRKRRKRHALPISTRRSVYEWVTIVLLGTVPLAAVLLFGATRYWILGPLLFCSFVGLSLYGWRPSFAPDLREVRIPPGGIAGLVFFLYGVALIPFAPVPHDARMEVLKIASYVGAYWAWTELATRYRRWRYLLGALILVVTVVSLYAIIQHFKESPLVWLAERHESYGLRASGTFLSPNHFASMLGMTITLCAVLVVLSPSGAFLRLISGYALLVCVPALFLTQGRAGWIGTVCGLATAIGLLLWKRNRRRFWWAAVSFPVLLVVLIVSLWHLSPTFKERLTETMPDTLDVAAQIRLTAWRDSLEMIREKPVFGHGPGSYRWIYPSYQSWTHQRWLRYAHNEYIHTAAEFGLVGLALFLVVVGGAAIGFLRAYSRATAERDIGLIAAALGALTAACVHAFFDFNLHVLSHGHVLALIGGVAAASLYASSLFRAKPLGPLGGYVLGGIVMAACIVMALISLQLGVSDILIRLGGRHEADLRWEQAEQAYARAARIDPGHWEPYQKLGDLYRMRATWERDPEYRRAKAEQALEYYRNVMQRNPGEMDAVFGTGKTWHLLGDDERTLAYLRRAREHSPQTLFYSVQLGLQLRQMGRTEEALEAFREAARIDPQDRVVRLNLRLLEQAANP